MSLLSNIREAICDILSLKALVSNRFNETDRRLSRIERKMDIVLYGQKRDEERNIEMSAGLDRVREEIAQNKDATAAATTLLASLSERIRNSAADETALRALADELDAQNASLAKAVTDNTPFSPSGNV